MSTIVVYFLFRVHGRVRQKYAEHHAGLAAGAAKGTVGDRKLRDHAATVVWQQEIRLLFAFESWLEAICLVAGRRHGSESGRGACPGSRRAHSSQPSPPTSELWGKLKITADLQRRDLRPG